MLITIVRFLWVLSKIDLNVFQHHVTSTICVQELLKDHSRRVVTWKKFFYLFPKAIWVMMLVASNDSWKSRSTTLPSCALILMSFIVDLISLILTAWNECMHLVENNPVMQILRNCRHKGPLDCPIFLPLFKILVIVLVRRYWNTWSCVKRNSFAIAGEDTITVCREPSRRYTRGPYFFAKCANAWCGDESNRNKLPTTGHGHGPGGKCRNLL